MTPLTLDAEPACPSPAWNPDDQVRAGRGQAATASGLQVERSAIADIAPSTWDALAARNPWATPFSGRAFQRAWWDAYGSNAHEETLVLVPAGASPGNEPVAIVPLMHRHEVEPEDALTHTTMRHGADIELTPVPPSATAVFFGAAPMARGRLTLEKLRGPALRGDARAFGGDGGGHGAGEVAHDLPTDGGVGIEEPFNFRGAR